MVASVGVSMYLTKDANAATLHQLASLATDSTLIMTFTRPSISSTPKTAPPANSPSKPPRPPAPPGSAPTAPREILALARQVGFTHARHIAAATLNARYFAARSRQPPHLPRRGTAGSHHLKYLIPNERWFVPSPSATAPWLRRRDRTTLTGGIHAVAGGRLRRSGR